VDGKLPEDKQAMISVIDEALALLAVDDSLRKRFMRKDALQSL
jgi:hypothetical protein